VGNLASFEFFLYFFFSSHRFFFYFSCLASSDLKHFWTRTVDQNKKGLGSSENTRTTKTERKTSRSFKLLCDKEQASVQPMKLLYAMTGAVRSGRGQPNEAPDLRRGRLEQCAKVELRRQGLVSGTEQTFG
jgi:hypothetical protein